MAGHKRGQGSLGLSSGGDSQFSLQTSPVCNSLTLMNALQYSVYYQYQRPQGAGEDRLGMHLFCVCTAHEGTVAAITYMLDASTVELLVVNTCQGWILHFQMFPTKSVCNQFGNMAGIDLL